MNEKYTRGEPLGLARAATTERRAELFAELREASEPIEEGWYALWRGSALHMYRVYLDEHERTRITLADGAPVPGGLRGEIEAYRAVGVNSQAATLLYGQRTGRCGHCGTPLPNVAARARGITPQCAMEMGWEDVVRASG